MHRVYVDAIEAIVVTPDYNDARRQFNKFVREYPDEVVDWDYVADPNATMQDIAEGMFDGRPTRVMQCCPY